MMEIKKLTIEVEAGNVSLHVQISNHAELSLFDRVIGALEKMVEQHESGIASSGEFRLTEGDSAARLVLQSNWQSKNMQELSNTAARLRDVHLASQSSEIPSLPASVESGKPRSGQRHMEASKPAPSRLDMDRSGWIHELIESNSRLGKILSNAGIESDELYMDREQSLPTEQRIDLAEQRFRHGLKGAADPAVPGELDIRVIAAFSPPWIEQIPMHLPGFPNRAKNVFTKERLVRMRQLEEMSPDAFLRLESFGRLTYQKVAESLSDHLMPDAVARLRNAEPETDRSAGKYTASGADFSGFDALWEKIIGLLDDERAADVLTRRIGSNPEEVAETLESIGNRLDVCRERIRQVEADAVAKLHSDARFIGLRSGIEDDLERQIDWQGKAIPLGQNCPIGMFHDVSPLVLKRFFQMVLKTQYKVLIAGSTDEGESARIVFGVSENELKQAINDVKRFMLDNAQERKSSFMPLVLEYIRNNFHETIHADLKTYVDEWTNWDYSQDPRIISFGDSIQAAVAAVLERSERPLKRSEIVDRARQEFGLEQTDASILNAVNELCANPGKRSREDVVVPVFQIGQGEYCTARHLPVDLDNLGFLVPELVSIICTGRECGIPGKPYQWHARDLLEELTRRVPDNELSALDDGLDWRVLDCMLRYHEPEEIYNLFKGRWVERGTGDIPTARTQQQAAEYVLRTRFIGQRVLKQDLVEAMREIQSLGRPTNPLQGIQEPVQYGDGKFWLDE